MDAFMEEDDSRQVIKTKLRQYFDGKIVRKDLTKHIKEGANVPVYVLEFLLGQYCSCLLYTSWVQEHSKKLVAKWFKQQVLC